MILFGRNGQCDLDEGYDVQSYYYVDLSILVLLGIQNTSSDYILGIGNSSDGFCEFVKDKKSDRKMIAKWVLKSY